jgi:hypothetical protein
MAKKRKDDELDQEEDQGEAVDVASGRDLPHPDAVVGAPKPAHVVAIGNAAREFLANLPPAAVSGGTHTFPEPAEDAEAAEVEDGKYRPAGSDWIFVWEGGFVREAIKAQPPDYGGEDVESIEI